MPHRVKNNCARLTVNIFLNSLKQNDTRAPAPNAATASTNIGPIIQPSSIKFWRAKCQIVSMHKKLKAGEERTM
jgi:hypothetical protein